MATSRSIRREIDALKKDIAGLRAEGKRMQRQAAAVASDGASSLGAIKEELVDRVSEIKDTLASGASGAMDEITAQLRELRQRISDYSEQADSTVKAHPFAAVAGALAVGWLIGRLCR